VDGVLDSDDMTGHMRDTATIGRVVAVLLPLLALVALAADAGVPWGSRGIGEDETGAGGSGGTYVAIAVLLGTTAAAVFILVRRWRRRKADAGAADLEEEESGPTDRFDRFLVSLMAYVLIALIAVAFVLVVRQADRWLPDGGGSGTATPVTDEGPRGGGGARGDTTWWLTSAVLVVVVAAAAAALWTPLRRRRRVFGGVQGDRGRRTGALVALVDDTVDDLRAERDPRKAIIAAYARMERGLARKGVPRRPWEAPLEYLGRVLRELRADARHVGRLTTLFERAKFSREELPPAAKSEAIDCLLSIRHDLQEAE
jgi:hypothetical protein